jgi:hypothetical protein
MQDVLYNVVFTLFTLSLLSERIAEWLKYQEWFKRIFHIKNTLVKLPSENEEQKRYYRILKINIAVSIVVALILRADLFYLVGNNNPVKLGWSEEALKTYKKNTLEIIQLVFGCILTGFFISFGSKLWHDILDIVLAFKDAKRKIENTFTSKAGVVLNSLSKAEQEAALEGAIELFGDKWKNTITNYTGVGIGHKMFEKADIKTEDLVLEFFVSNKTDDVSKIAKPVPAFVNYGGIMIPTDVKEKKQSFSPQWKNPGGKNIPPRPGESISRESSSSATGTISLKVEKSDISGETKSYLLSCFHIIFSNEVDNNVLEVKQGTEPRGGLLKTPGSGTGITTRDIANASHGCINSNIDAAIALLDNDTDLSNVLDEFNVIPEGIRHIASGDINGTTVKFCGAMSGKVSGIRIKAYNQSRDYEVKKGELIVPMKGLIELERCSEPGDSGAPVLDDDNNLIGIIIGADDVSSYVVPVQSIISKLGVLPKLKN